MIVRDLRRFPGSTAGIAAAPEVCSAVVSQHLAGMAVHALCIIIYTSGRGYNSLHVDCGSSPTMSRNYLQALVASGVSLPDVPSRIARALLSENV